MAQLVQALAWPATVLLIVLSLREPLATLIPLLQRLKYKDFELEFGRQVQELGRETQMELPASADAPATLPAAEALIGKLATLSPRSAVLESWRQVEYAVTRLAERRQVDLRGRQSESPLAMLRALQRAEALEPGKAGMIHELRSLRNNAAHTPDFALSTDSAMEYGRVAARIVEYVDSL